MLAFREHPGPPDAPTLVLLHAFPLSSRMWDRVAPLLAAHARVVTIDLPGLGGSAVPADDPSMAVVAREVLATLDGLDALDVGPVVLFGVSTGGYAALAVVAVQAAVQAAEPARARVAGLVLGSTSTRRIAPDDPADRVDTALEVAGEQSVEPVLGSAEEGLGATAHRDQPELVGLLDALIREQDPDGVVWIAAAVAAREDTTAVLAAYEGEVLLLFGEEDTATPPVRGEEMLAARDGDASLVVLPGTGHLTALEQPERTAEVVGRFLAGLSRPRA